MSRFSSPPSGRWAEHNLIAVTRTAGLRAAALASALPAVLAAATPAGAQPVTCPSTGPDTGRVTIVEPAAGAVVSGRVTVRGSAASPVDVARVELFVGDARKDFAVFDPPARNGTFVLAWESGAAPPGPATLRVVACGGGQGTVPLARGAAAVAVEVPPSSPQPPPAPLTPVTAGDPAVTRAGGPLWVGAAVGLSGLVGLAVASGYFPSRFPARLRRKARSVRSDPPPPADP